MELISNYSKVTGYKVYISQMLFNIVTTNKWNKTQWHISTHKNEININLAKYYSIYREKV